MTQTTLSKRIDASGIELTHKEEWSEIFKGEKDMPQATKPSLKLWAFIILTIPGIMWLRVLQLIFNEKFELVMEKRE